MICSEVISADVNIKQDLSVRLQRLQTDYSCNENKTTNQINSTILKLLLTGVYLIVRVEYIIE